MAHLKSRLLVNPVGDTHFEANYSLGKLLQLIDETHLCDVASSECLTIVYDCTRWGPTSRSLTPLIGVI